MEAGKLVDVRPTTSKKFVFTYNNTGVPHIRSFSKAVVTSPPGGSAIKLVNVGLV